MKLLSFKSIWLWFLIAIEFLKRHKSLLSLGVLVLMVLIFAQAKFNIFFPKNTIGEGLVGTFREHDLPLEVTRLISKSLVSSDENGRIKGVLVTGWEVNNDATIFKFKLKDGLVWADGSKVKAEDLQFDIPTTEITYPDDKTIQFKLKEAYSPLPSLLTKPVFKKGTLLGFGPYQIKKLEKSRIFITKISMEAENPDLPRLYLRFYPNEKVAATGFKMGEVQALLGISNPTVLKDTPQIRLKAKTDFSKIVTLLYNTKDPRLSNRSLRQALSYGAPGVEGQEKANNPYPASSWAYTGDSKEYLNKPQEAEEALKRAKSTLLQDQLSQELVLTATPILEEVGKMVVSAWKQLGFNVKLRTESGIPQNFQVVLITQSIPEDPDQYFLWHSSQDKTNLSKYSQARVDKDLEDGRKVLSEEDRKSKYQDFQKTLLEDAPATFLYFPKYNVVYLKKVEQLVDQVLNLQL